MPAPTTVEEYIAALPEAQRGPLEALRAAVTAAAPEAMEVITYEMPGLRLDDRFLVSYAAYRRHYSLFPASDAVVETLGDEVRPYLAGRGTIRFPADRPIPTDLVRRIVEVRLREHAAHGRRR
jgi:uncharacterized protein YdhG (YjbR/CyaY superfamily)